MRDYLTLSPVSPSPYQEEGEDNNDMNIFLSWGVAPLKSPDYYFRVRRVKERLRLSYITNFLLMIGIYIHIMERGIKGVRLIDNFMRENSARGRRLR